MRQIAYFGLLALAACTAPAATEGSPPPPSPATQTPPPILAQVLEEPTRILSQTDADRLLGNTGITLQWIDWDTRGPVNVRVDERGVWRLYGRQFKAGEEVVVDGVITEIGDGYFTLQGTVTIANTPDPGRFCQRGKAWHFAITQGRKYYRLREFEWCDELTDYVDIYF